MSASHSFENADVPASRRALLEQLARRGRTDSPTVDAGSGPAELGLSDYLIAPDVVDFAGPENGVHNRIRVGLPKLPCLCSRH